MTISILPTSGERGASRSAWLGLAFLLLLTLSDFIDRQVVVSLLPTLKSLWSLRDAQLGSLVSIVPFTVAIFSIPVAVLADRWNRVRMIAVMAVVWSFATIACSFATDYHQLMIARAAVGLGEAGYGPVGAALLVSLFPPHLRARVLAAFAAAASIGSVLGVVLGGIIAATWGWHWAFGIVGAPGLIIAILFALIVRDERRRDGEVQPRKLGFTGTMTALRQAPSALMIYFGSAIQVFLIATIYAWLPSYFNRSYGLAVDRAAAWSAVVLIVSSLSAIAWGTLADRLGQRSPDNKIWIVSGTAFASSVVLVTAFGLLPPGSAQLALILIGAAIMTGSVGTVNAIASDTAHPSVMATTVALGYAFSNVVGLAGGPYISGWLSDSYGLTSALTIVSLFGLGAGVAMAATLPAYRRDLARMG